LGAAAELVTNFGGDKGLRELLKKIQSAQKTNEQVLADARKAVNESDKAKDWADKALAKAEKAMVDVGKQKSVNESANKAERAEIEKMVRDLNTRESVLEAEQARLADEASRSEQSLDDRERSLDARESKLNRKETEYDSKVEQLRGLLVQAAHIGDLAEAAAAKANGL